MDIKYSFQADSDLYEWCERVIRAMTEVFAITEAEARSKVNDLWAMMDFRNDQLRTHLHETEEYWARNFYYGGNPPAKD